MLTPEQKNTLKGQAHILKPVVMISAQGITQSVFDELITQLEHHELIKIKIRAGDRERRKEIIAEIIEKTQAKPILAIGNIISIYKKSQSKKVVKK